MAKGELEGINFLTATRVILCACVSCRHNMLKKNGPEGNKAKCHFRVVELDQNGKCRQFEEDV